MAMACLEMLTKGYRKTEAISEFGAKKDFYQVSKVAKQKNVFLMSNFLFAL